MRYSKEFLMKVLKTYHHSSEICFKPKNVFTDDEIKAALSSYEKPIDLNEVIGIMDITIHEGGKKGYLLTEDRIYAYINRYPLELDDIIFVECDESNLIITTGTRQEIRWYAGVGAPYICEFINEIISIYDKEMDSVIEYEDASMMTVEDFALVWMRNPSDQNRILLTDALKKEKLYIAMIPELPSADHINIQSIDGNEFMMMNYMIMRPALKIKQTNKYEIQLYFNQMDSQILDLDGKYVCMVPISFEMCKEYLKKHHEIENILIEAYGEKIHIPTSYF